MPLRHIDGASLDYYLVLFDSNGTERPEEDGSLLSSTLARAVRDGVTDVFFASHGWKGDVPAAISQYDRWVAAMVGQAHDSERARVLDPRFKPLVVGVHWPSLPWGNESSGAGLLDDGDADEFAAEQQLDTAELVQRYSQRIADTDAARTALTTILAAAGDSQTGSRLAAGELPAGLEHAYETLFSEAGLGLDGAAAAPGSDQQTFTPALTISEWTSAAPGGGPAPGGGQPGLLERRLHPKREGRAADARAPALVLVHEAPRARGGRDRRAFAAGRAAAERAAGPVPPHGPQLRLHRGLGRDSWATAPGNRQLPPAAPGRLAVPRPGRAVAVVIRGAHPLPAEHAGLLPADRPAPGPGERAHRDHPLEVRSRGRDLLPARRQAGSELLLGEELPEFGGVGAFGIQGRSAGATHDLPVLNADAEYGFEAAHIYNIDASPVICHGAWPSGAHSDIAHPQIAHVFWQAALPAMVRS